MASKYERITDLYLQTAGEVATPEAWPRFLTTACHNFRLSFDKQVLLYAQRPDATAVLPMLSNSEFIVMLNQAESDQERLSRLLNISPEQMSYVNGAEAGCGLMRYGNALVPFVNRFPADTELYKLITTKPGEGMFAKGQVDFYA